MRPRSTEVVGLAVVAAVVGTAVFSLVGAWLGVHHGAAAAAGGLVGGGALFGWLQRRWRPSVDGRDAAALVGVTILAGALFLPGFPYAAVHRDPGVYVAHAVAMAEQGRLRITDPIFDTGADLTTREASTPQLRDDALRLDTEVGPVSWRSRGYRGFAEEGTTLLPRFYHLWPALLATAHDLGGPVALANVSVVLAVLSVGLTFLAGRRAFGPVAGGVAAVVLATTLLQVWQAKYPSSEALSQFLVVGALFAVALMVGTRSRAAAALAGLAAGATFLVRADGIYLAGLTLVALAGWWAVGRADATTGWMAATLVPVVGLGLYQAYGPAAAYSANQQGFPEEVVLAAGAVAVGAGALVVRSLPRTWIARATGPAARRRLLIVAAALLSVFLVAMWLRPQWQGVTERIDKAGNLVRAYDELNLRRLGWFLSVPGLVLAGVGLWVAALGRGVGRVILVPGLVFLPVLLWEPRIAPFLMWWGRRYTPVILPTLVLLVGLAVAWLVARRRPVGPVVAVLAVLVVIGINLSNVRPMWSVRDFAGSGSVIDQLDELDDRAVVVWQPDTAVRDDYAMTGLTRLGLPTVDPGEPLTPELLRALARAIPDRTLHVVTGGPVPDLEPVLEPVSRVRYGIERWPDTFDELPSEGRIQPLTVSVWRYAGDDAAGGAAPGDARGAAPAG